MRKKLVILGTFLTLAAACGDNKQDCDNCYISKNPPAKSIELTVGDACDKGTAPSCSKNIAVNCLPGSIGGNYRSVSAKCQESCDIVEYYDMSTNQTSSYAYCESNPNQETIVAADDKCYSVHAYNCPEYDLMKSQKSCGSAPYSLKLLDSTDCLDK